VYTGRQMQGGKTMTGNRWQQLQWRVTGGRRHRPNDQDA